MPCAVVVCTKLDWDKIKCIRQCVRETEPIRRICAYIIYKSYIGERVYSSYR